jgi:2,4-dienoyl-CoA reductase-like NADH-dependent reductase (Old Yellow Enzyme family)/NADPH-dependent 2,4-dienoyl-CoA reductase/sulfur reductase-like enzyme
LWAKAINRAFVTRKEDVMLKKLFSPFQIRGIVLENRIVMSGLASFLIEDDGSITDMTIEHYRKRAAGGPSMVIMEACAVSPEGIVSAHQARIYDDRFIEGLSKIASIMKSEGSVPAVQLHHGGRHIPTKVIGRKPLAPSSLPCPLIKGEVEPMTIEEIRRVIKDFGDSAARAVEAGFELIEIHGAHGYIINQFMSKFSNIREDEYGGDTKGRSRFALEIVEEVRKKVGPDFPLSFKISAQEFVKDGLDVAESIEILKLLEKKGVDVVHVSAGNDATPEWISQPMFMKQACLADSSAEIKKALEIPVMVVGRINDPVLADDLICEEKADLICMGRGLLADPELPLKAKEGRLEDIRKCIACNTCMQSIFRKGRIECLVNPALGREKEMEITSTKTPKKVMVVGGGPGGLNVAWVAAKRGHHVSLYEKNNDLGGQLILGSVSRYKKEMNLLIEFQKHQIKKFGVQCHLNTEVTLDMVKAVKPDEIVLATGSIPKSLTFPGVDSSIIVSLTEALNGTRREIKTVVIGGGATGCEIAHHLSEKGCPVTLVEQLPKIGAEIETVTRMVLLRELAKNNVKILTNHSLARVEGERVTILDPEGQEIVIDAEALVLAIGNEPDSRLFDQLAVLDIPIHKIGDCLEPRTAKAAIFDSAVLARSI